MPRLDFMELRSTLMEPFMQRRTSANTSSKFLRTLRSSTSPEPAPPAIRATADRRLPQA